MAEPTYPLHGVKVLELTHYIAGPYAAAILRDQGADVVKVEPPSGEAGRRAMPHAPDGESLYYAAYNRDKRSIALDLTDERVRPILDQLIGWADIVLTNFSPGVPDKLGFGWERVATLNQRAVMIHVTGFGSWSAIHDYLALDGIGQAMTGLASMTGEADGTPYISGVFISDHVTALQAALAASLGLQFRERNDTGTFIEVSMQRATASLLGSLVPAVDLLGERPRRTGNRASGRFTNVFPCSDGLVIIAPNTPKMWRALCEEIGRPDWGQEHIISNRTHIEDDGFRRTVDTAVADWTRQHSAEDTMHRLQARGVPCGMFQTLEDVCQDKLGLLSLESVTLANGSRTRIVGRAFDVNDRPNVVPPAGGTQPGEVAPAPTGSAVPRLGQHTDSILHELGTTDREIADLRASGAIR